MDSRSSPSRLAFAFSSPLADLFATPVTRNESRQLIDTVLNFTCSRICPGRFEHACRALESAGDGKWIFEKFFSAGQYMDKLVQ